MRGICRAFTALAGRKEADDVTGGGTGSRGAGSQGSGGGLGERRRGLLAGPAWPPPWGVRGGGQGRQDGLSVGQGGGGGGALGEREAFAGGLRDRAAASAVRLLTGREGLVHRPQPSARRRVPG